MQRDTLTQLLAAAVMVLCLSVSGVFAVKLTASSGRNRLVYTDKAVEADPPLAALAVGGLLQERIVPAACHATRYGPRVPEVRLMAIPDGGRLAGAALFTRVMAPDAFKSNAGAIVAHGVTGTGEGYAFTAW